MKRLFKRSFVRSPVIDRLPCCRSDIGMLSHASVHDGRWKTSFIRFDKKLPSENAGEFVVNRNVTC